MPKYFSISELCRTNTGLQNIPPPAEQANLVVLIENVLDPLRELYGAPIRVNSGYRSPMVNARVKGSKTSQHVKGQAADITAGSKKENKRLFDLIRANLKFTQLINENDYSWVHVGYDKNNLKCEVLAMVNGDYFKV
jgi:hypothetical protein